jgi:hypothetical protein
VKGFAAAVQAYEVVRPSTVESRFEALHTTSLTALVGREEESELLLRRWARAKTGEGQAVLVAGEAGIGKSRLTAALMERLGDEAHTRLRYFCSPQHTDGALYPIIGQMGRGHPTINRKCGSTSSTLCSRGLPPRPKTQRSLPRCCRSQTTDATPRSDWTLSNAGRERWKHLFYSWRP